MRIHRCRSQNGLFAQKKNFWGKIINIIFFYLLATFIVQNFKRFLRQIQSYEDAPFLDKNELLCRRKNFSREPVHEPCSFFYGYLHSKNQSQISIN